MMVATGWLSTYDVLCNCQCIKCGIWCGVDDKGRLINFESLPHSCKPAERMREYEKRRIAPSEITGRPPNVPRQGELV